MHIGLCRLRSDRRGKAPAALAGLQAGDLIVEADRQEVGDVDGLRGVLDRGSRATVLLLVKRQDASFFVAIRTQ